MPILLSASATVSLSTGGLPALFVCLYPGYIDPAPTTAEAGLSEAVLDQTSISREAEYFLFHYSVHCQHYTLPALSKNVQYNPKNRRQYTVLPTEKVQLCGCPDENSP